MSTFITKITAQVNKDHVNNVSYFKYLEEARKKIYALCRKSGTQAVIVHKSIDFIKEVFDAANLTIETTVQEIGNTSFTLGQKILANEELIASATVVIVTINPKTRKKVSVPENIKNLKAKNILI